MTGNLLPPNKELCRLCISGSKVEKFWLRLSYIVFINDLEMSVAYINKDALLLTLTSTLLAAVLIQVPFILRTILKEQLPVVWEMLM